MREDDTKRGKNETMNQEEDKIKKLQDILWVIPICILFGLLIGFYAATPNNR